MTPSGPFEVCEFVRAGIEADLIECGRQPVTTTYPGVGIVPWDDCCGQLVVGPERIFRTVSFPTEVATDEQCYGGDIAVSLLVTLVRCIPVPSSKGRVPTAAAIAAAHKNLLDDAAVVWKSVTAPYPVEYEWERALVDQQFVGASGGCIAVETRLTVGVSAEQWCGVC
jgi:hypothetical protein